MDFPYANNDPSSVEVDTPTTGLVEHEFTLVSCNGERTVKSEGIQVEHVLHVYLDSRPALEMVCSPGHPRELAVGRLYTEGLISSMDDVADIELSSGDTYTESGSGASSTYIYVTLKNAERWTAATPSSPERIHSCSSKSEVALSASIEKRPLSKVTPIPWHIDDIFSLATTFKKGSPTHKVTKGSHSCYLAQGASVLFTCEDLGRHNAFDKVIGHALIQGIDLRECTVFTSGRMPTDMIKKAIRTGIPIVISKAVPTHEALNLAEEFDISLICSAHPDSIKVFNDPLSCLNS